MAGYFFSVVIPTFNRRDSLRRCLDSLTRQSLSPDAFEVIVVDDGSTDGTGEGVREDEFPFAVRTIRIENMGPGVARNSGARLASGEYLAFLEDDVEVSGDHLERARAHLMAVRPDVLEGSTVSSATKRNVRRFEEGDYLSFIPCNLFVRKSVFDRLGGYDSAFFDAATKLYFREDIEFGFRVLDAGFVVRKAGDVIVEHPEQFTTIKSIVRHVRRYMFDPLLYKKHAKRFRAMLEVKKLFGARLHRPQHYLSIAYGVGLVWFVGALGLGWEAGVVLPGCIVIASSLLYRYKYQGRRAFLVYRLHETAAFLVLPAIYLFSVLKGCVRFKSFGALF